jgi:pyruvate formate lyase activating enzyme
MTDRDATAVESLLRAVEIGRAAGLRYVYAGNLPGRVGELENTRCPACARVVVERRGFRILRVDLDRDRCPGCRARIPGMWGEQRRVPRSDGRPLVLH